MTNRTVQQNDANEIDRRIFNLIWMADEHAKHSAAWRAISSALRAARVHVRFEMHPEDRDSTS